MKLHLRIWLRTGAILYASKGRRQGRNPIADGGVGLSLLQIFARLSCGVLSTDFLCANNQNLKSIILSENARKWGRELCVTKHFHYETADTILSTDDESGCCKSYRY